PEQACGEKIDERTDVWSLGVILFECLTSRRPIETENFGQMIKRLVANQRLKITDVRSNLPKDLVRVIEPALAVREKRPRDLRAMIKVLSRYADPTIPAVGVGPGFMNSAHTMGALADTLAIDTHVRRARISRYWMGIGVMVVASVGVLTA